MAWRRVWPYLPSVVTCVVWTCYMAATGRWHVYERGWPMAATAVVGSFVAGCSPLGGGAAAYPVLVLVIRLASREARVFSMMQQTVGMGTAMWRVLTTTDHVQPGLATGTVLLGIAGFQVGYFLLEVPSSYVQTVYFTFTFVVGVIVQLFVNRLHFGDVRASSVALSSKDMPAFVLTALLGGVLFSYVGTGADVLLYMYFRLFHNVEEVVAINYSIVLAACLSAWGFYNEGVVVARGGITDTLWMYWLCVVPVVAVWAPLGNWMTNRVFSRRFLNVVIYCLETFQYLAGFVITIHKEAQLLAISLSMIAVTTTVVGGVLLARPSRARKAAAAVAQDHGVACTGLEGTPTRGGKGGEESDTGAAV